MPHNHNGQKWIRNEKRCAIYARDGFRCVYCLSRDVRLVIDHVDPSGGNTEDNLVSACADCNEDKGSRTPQEWGVHPDVLAYVARQTFLPIDRSLGKRLEKARVRGHFLSLKPLRKRIASQKHSR